MANEMTKTEDKPASPVAVFRGQFDRMKGELAAALPPHVPVERFMRVVQTAVSGNPDLMNADRLSLFEAALKAAQDGLLPDGRDGALVIYNTKIKEGGRDIWIAKVQWMPMISGILKKVRNSGELVSISAYVAYERDHFEYVLGDDEKIEHRPAMGDRGKPVCAYAIAKTKDGGIYREVMTYAEIEQVRNVSRAKASGPWTQWWGEMARKTVLRRLTKRLPMSTDLDDLIRRDDNLYDFERGGAAGEAHGRLFRPVADPFNDEAPRQLPSGETVDQETGEITGAAEKPAQADQASAATAPAADPAEPGPAATEQRGEAGSTEAEEDDEREGPTAAYTAGREARKNGISGKRVPDEFASDETASSDWLAGWKEEHAAQQKGGGK